MGGFPADAFTPQPDGTLRCPARRPLYAQERRPERDVSVRARVGHCRAAKVACCGRASDRLPNLPFCLRFHQLLTRSCGETGTGARRAASG